MLYCNSIFKLTCRYSRLEDFVFKCNCKHLADLICQFTNPIQLWTCLINVWFTGLAQLHIDKPWIIDGEVWHALDPKHHIISSRITIVVLLPRASPAHSSLWAIIHTLDECACISSSSSEMESASIGAYVSSNMLEVLARTSQWCHPLVYSLTVSTSVVTWEYIP